MSEEGIASSAGLKKNYGATSDRIPSVTFSEAQFSPTEMLDLSEKVTANIFTINVKRKDLEQVLKTIGTPKDSQELRIKMHGKLLSANEVVDHTTKDLNKLTGIVKKGGKPQKLQVEKLMNNFTEAVQMYTRVQKQLAEKMRTQLLPSEHALLDDMNKTREATESSREAEDPNAERMATNNLEFEQGLLLEREERIKNVESCILDINQIMKEVGAMVYKQAEDINSIENAIETVHGGVEAGNSELEKAAVYHTKRRKKTLFLLGLSIAVGVILAIIIAVTLRK